MVDSYLNTYKYLQAQSQCSARGCGHGWTLAFWFGIEAYKYGGQQMLCVFQVNNAYAKLALICIKSHLV